MSPPERHRSQAAVFSERSSTNQADLPADSAISIRNRSIVSPTLLMESGFRPDRSVWRFDFERATGYLRKSSNPHVEDCSDHFLGFEIRFALLAVIGEEVYWY